MKPDYESAAIKATETLIKYHVASAPVMPLPILKSMPGVIVMSYAEIADKTGIDRHTAVHMFGPANQDAATTVGRLQGTLHYVIAYNQRLPFYMLQRSLARELGHIVLQHDGSRPDAVRTEEAITFARYFLCPRPLVRAMQEAGLQITNELIGNVTGCFERCISGLRTCPGINVPPALNRAVRANFADYIANLIDFHACMPAVESAPADLGSYMDNYME